MPKAKKYQINVYVTGLNVKKGVCGDMNKCAIADAFVRQGFRAVSVSTGVTLGESLNKGFGELEGEVIEFPLSKSAHKLISEFDELDGHDTVQEQKEARKALAAKLDAKPLTVSVKLTSEEAKKYLTAKAYKALTAVAA